jgi:hypothetical protein
MQGATLIIIAMNGIIKKDFFMELIFLELVINYAMEKSC